MAGHEERRERRERWLQTVAFFGALVVLAVVLYLAFVVQGNRPEEAKEATTVPVRVTARGTPSTSLAPTPARTPYPRPLATAPSSPEGGAYPPMVIATPTPSPIPSLPAGGVHQ